MARWRDSVIRFADILIHTKRKIVRNMPLVAVYATHEKGRAKGVDLLCGHKTFLDIEVTIILQKKCTTKNPFFQTSNSVGSHVMRTLLS